ncbi:receptor expression-enhancing protein 5-like [Sycon ciliatum]|uniref:receptor expression-enhancing protein 5-like n=1 Tax=Sycon ciliatum TaxID=27933 RepID=UPI0020AAA1BD|eukprot:scpid73733/ scgid34842/ Receptor expression-enhancing protein 5
MAAYLERVNAFLDSENPVTEQMNKITEKTGVKKQHQFFAFVGVILLWFIFGYGASLLCSVIGFIYPAYRSLKALESKEADDDRICLVYWVIYAFFSVIEFFSDIFLGWIPFYYLLKCAFLVWCMVPGPANGSLLLYEKVLRPVFLKHEKQIDQVANKALSSAKEVSAEASNIATSAADQVTEYAVQEGLRHVKEKGITAASEQ